MRQYVLTRSAYGPSWTPEANRRRLELTAGITVPTLAAQTSREWTWVVALDRRDPLRDERLAILRRVPVEVEVIDVETAGDPSTAAMQAYRAPWADALGPRDERLAMTRLDDDDGLAPWALRRVGDIALKVRERSVLVLPRGLRIWGGRCTVVRHDTNAMQTLVTLPGDELDVYAYQHRRARQFARLRAIDNRLAWVWARHDDTISGWHTAESPLHDRLRELFPIDWALLERAGGSPRVAGEPLGRYFR